MCPTHETRYPVKRRSLWWLPLACLFAGASWATAAPTALPVRVEYRQATDVFHLLDNLPDWLPGYTAADYGKYWNAHVGMDKTDRALLAAYAAFRRRTAPAAQVAPTSDASAPDVFAPPATRDVDAFAQPFLDAPNFEAGAAAAIATQAPRDRAMLRRYFSRFGPRAERLVAHASHFEAQRAALTAQLAPPGVRTLADDMHRFYGVGKVPTFIVRFVWWPDPDRTQAKVRGRYILLQGPADGAADGSPMDWAPIVMHEYAHYVSAGQPAAQRHRLSAEFLRGCPKAAALPNPLNAFEEPLAIYWGQYRFALDVRGSALPTTGEWYFRPMPDHIAKAIAVAFPSDKPSPLRDDPALMSTATKACLQLTSGK